VGGGGATVRGAGGATAVVDRLALGEVTTGETGCELGLDAMLVVGSLELGEPETLGVAVPVPPLAVGWLVRPPTRLIATNRPTAQIAQLTPTRRVGWLRRNRIPRFHSDLGLSGSDGGGGGRTCGGKDTDPPKDLHSMHQTSRQRRAANVGSRSHPTCVTKHTRAATKGSAAAVSFDLVDIDAIAAFPSWYALQKSDLCDDYGSGPIGEIWACVLADKHC
jgi:hypothetical protein